MSSGAVCHGPDALGDALADALDRSGYWRVFELLAAVVAHRADSRGERMVGAEVETAERAFAEAADAVVQAWRAHDVARRELRDAEREEG